MRTLPGIAAASLFCFAIMLFFPSCDDGRRTPASGTWYATDTAANYGVSRIQAPSAAGSPDYIAGRLPVAEARERLAAGQGAVLVDVRSKLERDIGGRVPGDISIPLAPEETFTERVTRIIPDKTTTVYLYCATGMVSSRAAFAMHQLGYVNVFLVGTAADWGV